ncbi:MAG: transcription-repair coupling factor [Solobacterium sp.]|nr:transcription-repair coupling factor [Solobacterium sp.]
MPLWLQEELKNNPAVRKLDREKGPLPLTSLIEEALVIAASYRRNPRSILVIKQNLYNAQRLYERLVSLLGENECALFGADESLRVEAIASSPELTAQKVETMASLLRNPKQVVVTCPSGFLRQLPSVQQFKDGCISLKTGDEADPKELMRRLFAGGYTQTSHIDQPLCFAHRGGILDIFSINYEYPVRIEFFDTEIESIRFFDVITQKTIQNTDSVEIVPASDVIFSDEQIEEIRNKAQEMLVKYPSSDVETDLMSMEAHVFERRMYPYLALLSETEDITGYMEEPLIILSDEQLIREAVKRQIDETTAYIQEMVQEGKILPKYAVYHDYNRIIDHNRTIAEDPFTDNCAGIQEIHLPNEPLNKRIRIAVSEDKALFALGEKEFARVTEILVNEQIPYQLITDQKEIPEGLSLCLCEIPQGFHIEASGLHVYTEAELFEIHHRSGRYENKFRSAEVIHGYDELKPMDYIVHAQYGVGQYIGIETREIQGSKRDFLKIVYRGNAELLVPLEQFRLVRKFVSREGVVPRLNKLGSGEWEKTKKRLEENVNNIAERLISLYAAREQHIGHAFSPDNEMTVKFEQEFPFELTADQEKAVEAVKHDMESDKPMDRLVCGDVGFGKTEVAVRASFKAVTDNKQTALLCPTTILADQHYRTFMERYKNFPVMIRLMNRFVTAAEQKQTIRDLKEGRVDIVIGTHRLLSSDVEFKDLGLLIIDEEQRFGVEHKEKIKELKNGIDVLALSATPIPRTLQMSLIGIRSLSQLETPPLNRYSVQTYVVERNAGLITDAIQKELARNGQVFYLHNNIEQIYSITRRLRHALPEARIGIVHGKMDREEIEDIMNKVIHHEIDVLVCTTIVENGIDIPNVNTILIDNAQDFGLAQIYQIKGRVGRSSRIAYAYLLIPPRRQLSEIAQKRLSAVKEFARLGSGYKIAMRDLTIRGAGDLLGPDQSGFIDTVGIDMYIEMLEEAIREKKNEKKPEQAAKPPVNLPQSGYIPENFAPDDFDKLDMYQKIDALNSEEKLEEYKAEVIDQYGKLPAAVQTLFEKKHLDLALQEPYVQSYRETPGAGILTFSTLFSQNVDGVRLFENLTKLSKDITIRYTGGTIIVNLPKGKNRMEMAVKAIRIAGKAQKHENR